MTRSPSATGCSSRSGSRLPCRGSNPPAGSCSSPFLPSGEPWELRWGTQGEAVHTSRSDRTPLPLPQRIELSRLLLEPGESLGPSERVSSENGLITYYPVVGGRPAQGIAERIAQRIAMMAVPGTGMLVLHRQIGTVGAKEPEEGGDLPEILLLVVPLVGGVLTTVAVFLVLLGKRRIDFVNGLALAGLLLAIAAASILFADPNWRGAHRPPGRLLHRPLGLRALVFRRVVPPRGPARMGGRPRRPARRPRRTARRPGAGERLRLRRPLAGLRLALMAAAALPATWPAAASVALPVRGPFHQPGARIRRRPRPGARHAAAAGPLGAGGGGARHRPPLPSGAGRARPDRRAVANALFAGLLVWICRRPRPDGAAGRLARLLPPPLRRLRLALSRLDARQFRPRRRPRRRGAPGRRAGAVALGPRRGAAARPAGLRPPAGGGAALPPRDGAAGEDAARPAAAHPPGSPATSSPPTRRSPTRRGRPLRRPRRRPGVRVDRRRRRRRPRLLLRHRAGDDQGGAWPA